MQEQQASGATVAVGIEQPQSMVTRYRLDQRLLHWTHTAFFLGLVGTGIPLLPFRRLPFGLDFRAWIGGYSSLLMSWHTWVAVAFISLPSAIFVISRLGGRSASKEQGRAKGVDRVGLDFPSSRARILNQVKRAHVWITILMASAFALTGSLMWARSLLSFPVVEWSYYLHDVLTYLSIPLILGHLVVLHLLGAPEAMRGMVLGMVSREWAESVAPRSPEGR